MENVLLCIIVEDEPLAQQVLDNYISQVDQLKLVAKCETVDDAYQVIVQNNIDVVFLDLNLEAVSGLDLIKEIKPKIQKPCYFIITSGFSANQVDTNGIFQNKNLVLVDHLMKPFSFSRFEDAIKKLNQIRK
jgi:response regulator of citrate/malate metabolism